MFGQPGYREGAAVSAYEVGGIQAADADPSISQQRPMLSKSSDLPAHLSRTRSSGSRRVGLWSYKQLLVMTANVRL